MQLETQSQWSPLAILVWHDLTKGAMPTFHSHGHRHLSVFNGEIICLQIFNGNSDRNTTIKNILCNGIIARSLRITVRDCHGNCCMRVEPYGVPMTRGTFALFNFIYLVISLNSFLFIYLKIFDWDFLRLCSVEKSVPCHIVCQYDLGVRGVSFPLQGWNLVCFTDGF